MNVTLIATRRVRHVAAWISDSEASQEAGFRVGGWRPICGSTASVRTTGTTFVFPTSPDSVKARPLCTRCTTALAQAVALIAGTP